MEGAPYAIPSQFTAKQKILHSKLEMKLKNSDNQQFGLITEKAHQLGRKFELTDGKGNLVAVAIKIVNSPDTTLEIKDNGDHKIGSIDHSVTKSALDLRDKLTVHDDSKKALGKTDEFDIIKQTAILKGDDGAEIGQVKRDKSLTGDSFECRFLGNTDRRILVFLPAFISVLQDQKKEKEKQLKKEEK